MNRSLKVIAGIMAMGLAMVCGCQPGGERAVDRRSAGEFDSWECSGRGLVAQAVVSLYEADGSRYLTEQTHWICGTAGISITAQEPTGLCRWELGEGRFSAGPVAQGAEALCSPAVATAVYVLFGLTDPAASVPVDAEGRAEKLDGRWFEAIAIDRVPALQIPQGLNVTLLRPVGSDRVDHVRVVDEQGRVTIAQAYDYRRLTAAGRTVPGRIEVRPVSGLGRLDFQYVQITPAGSARAVNAK